MKIISSCWTPFEKWLFPMLTMLVLAAIVGLFGAYAAGHGGLRAVWIPLGMVSCLLILQANRFWNCHRKLADKVQDGDDFLVILRGGKEARVRLSDIVNINVSHNAPTAYIALRIRQPSLFGDEIAFVPVQTFFVDPYTRNPVAEDLIQRVDRARQQDSRR